MVDQMVEDEPPITAARGMVKSGVPALSSIHACG
jgi:hypothetical protein